MFYYLFTLPCILYSWSQSVTQVQPWLIKVQSCGQELIVMLPLLVYLNISVFNHIQYCGHFLAAFFGFTTFTPRHYMLYLSYHYTQNSVHVFLAKNFLFQLYKQKIVAKKVSFIVLQFLYQFNEKMHNFSELFTEHSQNVLKHSGNLLVQLYMQIYEFINI